ncbi:hypothetical protein [Halarsenatibacter silvermanii]|uniref:beta-galactosidase n=1 Tax=Halarsenatibacter silvermanii TaxID=321763 RepID=A0A1G9QQ12_9FIRM|nr:hypothetical protein [Halarsenatibacter silvermanii]SDM12375.1 Beta galactosidase small chain [Halarsenatibacter silvermanii]
MWSKAGKVLVQRQLQLKDINSEDCQEFKIQIEGKQRKPAGGLPLQSAPPFDVQEKEEELVFENVDRQIGFDRMSGKLRNYSHQGRKLLHSGPRINLWRVPVDNDKSQVTRDYAREWRNQRIHRLQRTEEVHLQLISQERGLGSTSCGPELQDKYELELSEFQFSLRLTPQ